jgi:hypothetical protein
MRSYFELPLPTGQVTPGWMQTFYNALERMLRPLANGELPELDSLPEASVRMYSRMVILNKETGDEVYVCLRGENGDYVWRKVTLE